MTTFNKITKFIVGINKDTEVHDNQDSSVSIVTTLHAGQSGFESRQRKDTSLFSMSSRQGVETSQPSMPSRRVQVQLYV